MIPLPNLGDSDTARLVELSNDVEQLIEAHPDVGYGDLECYPWRLQKTEVRGSSPTWST
jgi:hypothetical protein